MSLLSRLFSTGKADPVMQFIADLRIPATISEECPMEPGVNYSLFGSAGAEVDAYLRQKLIKAIVTQLQEAATYDKEKIAELRDKATFGATATVLMIAVPEGKDPETFAKEVDEHDLGACGINNVLLDDATDLVHYLGLLMQVQPTLAEQIEVTCATATMQKFAGLCEAVNNRGAGKRRPYTIRISHGFWHLCLAAAKTCAARYWLDDGTRNGIEAKEINDVLRSAMVSFFSTGEAPREDNLAGRMLPHQLLITNELMHGMRLFALAHELSHVLVWAYPKRFVRFKSPPQELYELPRLLGISGDQAQSWVDELAADMLAVHLVRIVNHYESQELPEASMIPIVKYHWRFAGADLFLALWGMIAQLMEKHSSPLPSTHPTGQIRQLMVRLTYPMWIRSHGSKFSDMLIARMSNLFGLPGWDWKLLDEMQSKGSSSAPERGPRIP